MRYRIPALTLACLILSLLAFWPESTEVRDEVALILPSYDSLRRIQIEVRGHPTIVIHRASDGWKTDDGEPVDSAILSLLEERFAKPIRARHIRLVDTPVDYGLDDSSLRITLDGETSTTLTIGRVKDKRVTFVEAEEPRGVFRVPTNLAELFQRPREDWVEKTLFPASLTAVRRVTLERQGEIEWRVERPDAKARWIMDVPRDRGRPTGRGCHGRDSVGARALNFPEVESFEDGATGVHC